MKMLTYSDVKCSAGEEDKLLPDVTLYLVKTDDNTVTLMSLERTQDDRYDICG